MKSGWFYGVMSGLAIILLTYYMDIRLVLSEREQLNAELLTLQEQTMQWHKQQAAQIVAASYQRAKTDWPDFFKAVNLNHAIIKAIIVKKDGVSAYQDFHVRMEPLKYEELIYLLSYLARDNSKYAIMSFAFDLTKHNLLRAELTIRDEVSKPSQPKSNVDKTTYTLPFCGKYHLPKLGASAAQHYSIKLIQLRGVMQFGQQKYALIAFPDGASLWMRELQQLGSEGGQIQSINLHQILVSMPNGRTVILGGI